MVFSFIPNDIRVDTMLFSRRRIKIKMQSLAKINSENCNVTYDSYECNSIKSIYIDD